MNLRSKILCIFFSNFLVDPLQEVFSNGSLEILLVHKFGRDLLILLHAVDKEPLQRLAKDVSKVFHRVGNGRLTQVGVGHGVFADRIEEKLVTRLEFRAKPLIEDVDQLGKLYLHTSGDPGAHGRRSRHRLLFARFQVN